MTVMDTPTSPHDDDGDPERNDPARGQPGASWPDSTGAYELGEGTLALLADLAFDAPLVPRVLDAYLKDRGADTSRRWRLVLTGAEVVAVDGDACPPAPRSPRAVGPA